MNILVVGCGKVGSQLSNILSSMGHDTAVIDPDSASFERLSDDFRGYTVAGVPIDQTVLRRGGIEACDAVAAVTEDDNTNVMVCQLAREVFHVPRVLARVFDPKRGDVFSQFGLPTVCPTNLSIDAIYAMLTGQDQIKNVYLDSATVSFDARQPEAKQVGMTLGALCSAGDARHVLFGLLHEDGNLTLAYARSQEPVGPHDRLLYARVID